jgi:hypothetical protein
MGTVVELNARRDSIRGDHRHSPLSRPHTVRLAEPIERAYWCRHFNASEEQLSGVVKEVGSNPAIVQLYLYRR